MIAIIANVNIEIIELLVLHKPSLVMTKNNEEVSPIHEAVKNRRLDVVKLLLEHGANVNDFDLDLENVLHLAASNSDYDILEFLLNETEVDSRAKNRDEMNPLCLLLVRSRNEMDQDLVSRCFFMLLEHTYDKNQVTNTYTISDIFQCAFLACVYSHTEVVKFIIHNIYSVNNSKYEFIRKLSEYCEDENAEFLYYILVFLHDDINRYDQFSFPRFSEINFFMCIRSTIHIIEILLTSDEAVEMIISILQHMNSIGFNIRVKEFEDQVGALLLGKYSSSVVQEDVEKVDRILRYLLLKGFKLNLIVKSYLHSIAIARDVEAIDIESTIKVLKILLHYATTFFNDLENWKQINDFKNLNPPIRKIVEFLVMNFGNLRVNAFLDMNFVYSLKHFCRNRIREQLKFDPDLLCNHDLLKVELGLPEVLINYVAFKE
jgi:hypothetical protein